MSFKPYFTNSHSAYGSNNNKGKTRRFIARKVDWEKARDRNNEIGDQGEEFVLEFEIDRLIETLEIERGIAVQNVQHLSRLQGDGLGYDIFSMNDNGSPRYIEVKTTSGGFNQPFYMSKNEKNLKNMEILHLYTVFIILIKILDMEMSE